MLEHVPFEPPMRSLLAESVRACGRESRVELTVKRHQRSVRARILRADAINLVNRRRSWLQGSCRCGRGAQSQGTTELDQSRLVAVWIASDFRAPVAQVCPTRLAGLQVTTFRQWVGSRFLSRGSTPNGRGIRQCRLTESSGSVCFAVDAAARVRIISSSASVASRRARSASASSHLSAS